MDIIRIIQETATWIEKVNSDFEVNLFRTKKLSPKHYFCEINDAEKLSVLNSIVTKRSKFLKRTGVALIPVHDLVNYGRLMFFYANDTVTDGAPMVESACFVDVADTPPWDTWVALGQQLNNVGVYNLDLENSLLIAWVPKSQYFYAQEAIAVACVDNFYWPDDSQVSRDFVVIKEIFSEPDHIVQPDTLAAYENREVMMTNIMAEHDKNYDQRRITTNSLKKSFINKLFLKITSLFR